MSLGKKPDGLIAQAIEAFHRPPDKPDRTVNHANQHRPNQKQRPTQSAGKHKNHQNLAAAGAEAFEATDESHNVEEQEDEAKPGEEDEGEF